jgi:serine protease Do
MSHVKSLGVVVLAAGFGLLGEASSLAQPLSLHTTALLRIVGLPGKSPQGYLGVDLRNVSEDQATALKLKEARGAEIIGVDHDAPACKAGLLLHDVVLQMNGQAIDGEDQLRRMLRETPPGKQVSFLISRDGQQQTVQVQLSTREEVERQAWQRHYVVPEPTDGSYTAPVGHAGNSFLSPSKPGTVKGTHSFLGTTMLVSSSYTGAKLEVMGPQLAEFFGAQASSGLLVRSVDPNSPAADAGLRAGDVVVKVNSLAIASANDWSKTIHENRGHPVNIVVLRDRKEHILTLTPDGKKRSSVEPWTSLEGFFGDSAQAQETRATLAELEPTFDAISANLRHQLEEVRSTAQTSPEMTQIMARLNALSNDPGLQRQLQIARRQVMAAAEAARKRMNSPELRDRMNSMHDQMRDAMRLD